MSGQQIPQRVLNRIGGKEIPAHSGRQFEKLAPADGKVLCRVARSDADDIAAAVDHAREAQKGWAEVTPVKRGAILHDVAMGLRQRREEVAAMVARETGKSLREARGETDAAVALGLFMAGEGQRLYGRTTTSGVPDKYAMTIRQPIGVAGLIIAANTPIANVAWKVFPALVCGNAAVLKGAEDAPVTAWIFGRIAEQAGLPAGVLNIVHGYRSEERRVGEECRSRWSPCH